MLLEQKNNEFFSKKTPRPLTMQYLGGKSRIVESILEEISRTFSQQDKFVDLFAGSGVVAFEAQCKGYDVIANDIQPYSATILTSLLNFDTCSLKPIITELEGVTHQIIFSGSREKYLSDYFQELSFFNQVQQEKLEWKEYKNFVENTKLCSGNAKEIETLKGTEKWTLFLSYYRNTYFGIYQSAELDFLREFAEKFPKESKEHILACIVSAMTYCVSSTTHLAQFLKPNSQTSTINLIKKRSTSIVEEVLKRLKALESNSSNSRNGVTAKVFQKDFKSALKEISLDSNTIVYADPPYFKEHYSRYYHVLDTFILYDYPQLTYNKRIGSTTIGRYREDRITSDFGKKALAKSAFESLIDSCMNAGAKLAISYACSSIVDSDFFHKHAIKRNLKIEVKEFYLKHTGQGQARHKDVTEYLFLISQ
ncbi:DNA adenine methylase [Shewanella mangrovisoli]|uniref:DNA adenine methylase n=1 Tax=Shewanella mangrovisoli TaxID=2864211 RepID=UPI0035B79A9E